MNYVRFLVGAALAAVVTAGLFYLMPLLIESADKTIDDKEKHRLADITMPDRDIETNVKEKKPDKPKDPEEPPPELEPQDFDDVEADPDAVNMAPSGKLDLSLGKGSGFGSTDGEYIPLAKVQPVYPRRAQSRGVSGYCIVEFTVTKAGSVRDPSIVECEPQGYFERSSLKAALKFKYKPRVVDGEPIEVAGVQNKLTYEIAD